MSQPPAVFAGLPLAANGQTWDVPASLDAELAKTFPAIDRQAEYQHAKAWLMVTPTKRKTAKGMPRFLLNWLETAQNRGAAARGARAADDRCAFHRAYGTRGKRPPSTGWIGTCPECREGRAAAGTRQSEPAASRDLVAETEAKLAQQRAAASRAASPDELARLRAERSRQGQPEPQPPAPPGNGSFLASPRPPGTSAASAGRNSAEAGGTAGPEPAGSTFAGGGR